MLHAGSTLADRIEVICASSSLWLGKTTICDTRGSFGVQSEGPEVYHFVTLTALTSLCSDVSYLRFRPIEANSIAFSTPLSPGQSQNVEIGKGFAAGEVKGDVRAIGRVGGCNTGVKGSWAADLSAAPVP